MNDVTVLCGVTHQIHVIYFTISVKYFVPIALLYSKPIIWFILKARLVELVYVEFLAVDLKNFY